jgi:hypothetical protein
MWSCHASCAFHHFFTVHRRRFATTGHGSERAFRGRPASGLVEGVMPSGDVDHREEKDWDGVGDASLDSFPASDPPSWTGTHIGGPRRGSVAPRSDSPARRTASMRAHVAPDGRSSDGRWLEERWPSVHVCFADVLRAGAGSSERRPRLRAVVQLGGLTPADVQVTARLATGPASASREPLRLWSVQSHHNGAFVFEAAAATEPTLRIVGAPDLLVTVAPAAAKAVDVALTNVVRVVPCGERADCASSAGVARAPRLAAFRESRPGASGVG